MTYNNPGANFASESANFASESANFASESANFASTLKLPFLCYAQTYTQKIEHFLFRSIIVFQAIVFSCVANYRSANFASRKNGVFYVDQGC